MSPSTNDLYLENIESSHNGTIFDGKRSNLDARDIVHAVDTFAGELVKQPRFNHCARAALVLFCWLKNEMNGTGELPMVR